MRRLILILMMGALLAFPHFASAQSSVRLSRVTVQLWPEYDQPSMLVIVDFLVDPAVSLPVDLTFRIPAAANLIAVAMQDGEGNFLNTEFNGPTESGDWQAFTMPIRQTAHYRFEYYQPLTFNGNQRLFSYLWPGDYKVDALQINVLEPLDTVSLTTDPAHRSIEQVGGLTYYVFETEQIKQGEPFAFNLQYEKTTDALVFPPQGVQPAAPLDEDTPGRVSWNNSLPYLIGGLGVILIVGGVLYYLQSGRASSQPSRRRRHSVVETELQNGAESYCPQCGTRAKPGDRFCRICGARLRSPAE